MRQNRCSHVVVATSVIAVWSVALLARADVRVVVDRVDNTHATAEFKFPRVPAPSATDAATGAKFTLIDGRRDPAAGDLNKLNDGRVPETRDEPADNLFFDVGTDGGRIRIDLGAVGEVQQVNTYSWHADNRAPQV